MKVSIDMPAVNRCTIAECSYNAHDMCHARAITIGDGESPRCDTVFCGDQSVQETKIQAGVGACKVSNCNYNSDLECTADAIQIGMKGDNVNCLTYTTG